MEREDSLHAFIVDDPADRKRLVDAPSFAHDDGAGKDLDAFLFAFDDSRRNVDGVANFELRGDELQVRLLYQIKDFVRHGNSGSIPNNLLFRFAVPIEIRLPEVGPAL